MQKQKFELEALNTGRALSLDRPKPLRLTSTFRSMMFPVW